ncbi:MAG: anthranilate synthase component I family protein [Pseudomonadota bacterium]
MTELKRMIGRIRKVDSIPADFIERGERIEALYEKVSGDRDSFLLLSGGDGDCARYSFIFADPFLTVQAWGRKIRIEGGANSIEVYGDPFDVVQEILDRLAIPGSPSDLPFGAGAVGYFGYDLRYHIEKLPDLLGNDLPLPDLYLIFPRIAVIYDRRNDEYRLATAEYDPPGNGSCSRPGVMEAFKMRLRSETAIPPSGVGSKISSAGPSSSFTRESYMSAVERARDYIRKGDIYQVNLSQRFSFPFNGSPYPLFQALFKANPAAFYAYLNCGDFCVISTSPERFIYRRGDYIETRPIKGTRPRGTDKAEDDAMKRELMGSRKEDAELSMIVDLLRNDLGKICLPGTVCVKKHKRIETYQNVFHLVSIIAGRVNSGYTQMDVLKALFPGGSITGCPKIRAMEIIEELETVKRGIYTGAIGYVGPDVMNLSIAIRMAAYKDGRIYLSVGGGIVYSSDPEAEYQETLDKGQTFFDLLKC